MSLLQKAKAAREKRAAKIEEMKGILDKASTENRSMSEDENTKWKALKGEAETLLREAETFEEQARLDGEVEQRAQSNARVIPGPAGNQSEVREKQKLIRGYEFKRAIRAQLGNKPVDGVEGEMHQEAIKEAREAGVNVEGTGVPSWFMSIEKRHQPGTREYRDMTAGTTTEGGHTIQTDLGELIPALTPRLMTVDLGATVLSGLTGNLDMPRDTTNLTATWKTENATADELNPVFDKISFTPNRLTAFTDVSRTLIAQSSISVENFIRRKLDRAVAIALDAAAINGSGTAPTPRGILNQSGIGSVVGGTNGAAPTYSHIVDLETEVAVDNADMGRLAYLTTPGIRGKLKKTAIESGDSARVWVGQELNGYRAAVSTQVPSTLTKGSSSGICHAVIFGNWEELMIGQWSGIDFIINPYTKGKEGLVEVIVHSWWDIDVAHAQSFAAMVDALLS